MTAVMPPQIARDVPLAPLTSWRVGGPAENLAMPETVEEMGQVLTWARERGIPVTVLGGGTNVLVSDRGVRGLTISLRQLSSATVEIHGSDPGRLHVECLSGTSKSDLLKIFLKHRLAPALFMAGLPGNAGGGVVMNAGVSERIEPREFVEITDWVEVLRWTGHGYELVRLGAADLQWSYRHCHGWQEGGAVIVRLGLSWPLLEVPEILSQVRAANRERARKQPLDMPSCGSVFINPPGQASSGALIERAGLKGYSVGGAKISEKHANFIVNSGGATATDIDAVIRHARRIVLDMSGIDLKTEVVYMGEWP